MLFTACFSFHHGNCVFSLKDDYATFNFFLINRPVGALKMYIGALKLIYMLIVISIIDVGNKYKYDQIREMTDVSRTEDKKLSIFFS
jgi:hypothetical protein